MSDLKDKIEKVLEDDVYNSITKFISLKNKFFNLTILFEVLVDIFHCASIVTGSLAYPLNSESLTVASIICNIISITTKLLKRCSKKENNESINNINILCKKVGLNNDVPILQTSENDITKYNEKNEEKHDQK